MGKQSFLSFSIPKDKIDLIEPHPLRKQAFLVTPTYVVHPGVIMTGA